MTTQPVEMILKDARIVVTIGTGFYAKLREVLMSTFQNRTEEEILKANEQIENSSVTEQWIRNYETMAVLCKEIEKQATVQGLTYMSDLNTEVERFLTEVESSESEAD